MVRWLTARLVAVFQLSRLSFVFSAEGFHVWFSPVFRVLTLASRLAPVFFYGRVWLGCWWVLRFFAVALVLLLWLLGHGFLPSFPSLYACFLSVVVGVCLRLFFKFFQSFLEGFQYFFFSFFFHEFPY